jgi:hypothetical protein
MPLLDSISIDYTQEEGFMIVPTVVSTGIYALSDSSTPYTDQSLTLGASGDIKFFVDDTENSLTLSVSDTTCNMQISTSNSAIELLPSDTNRTIYLDDLMFSKEANKNVITTQNSLTTLELVSSNEILLKSKVNVLNDLNLEGQLYTPNLNIANSTHGFMFQLSADSNLELIKYDKTNSYGQLVAIFGKGSFEEDTNFPIQTYGGTTNELFPTSGGGGSVWSIDGTNILYTDGTTTVKTLAFDNDTVSYTWDGTAANLSGLAAVGLSAFSNDMGVSGDSLDPNINSTSITTSNLTVHETALFSNLTVSNHLIVSSIDVTNGISITSLVFEDANNYEWNGHASNLYGLDQLALSALSNDLNLQGGDPNINSDSITTSNLTVHETALFSNLTVSNQLIVSSIDVTNGISITSLVFEDANDYEWNGHASNLYGLDQLALSALSNDLNLQGGDPNINSDSIETSNLTVHNLANFGSNVLIGGDVTISSNLVVNSIEIIGGLAIQSMVFEDLANHEWDGHASNLYALDNLALSALSNDLPLSAFSNDMNLQSGGSDPNVNSVSVTTSNLTVLETASFSNVTISNTLTVNSMIFDDTGSHEWNGHASNLYGLDQLALSTLSNDMDLQSGGSEPNVSSVSVTTSNLTVLETATFSNAIISNDLTVSSIKCEDESTPGLSNIAITGHFIPTVANMYDLGSIDFPFKSLYAAASTIYLGTETSMSVEGGSLNIAGASLKPEKGLKFADGSQLGSLQDVAREAINAVSSTTAKPFGDFTRLDISYNNAGTIMKGEYTFSENYREGSLAYKIYDYINTKLIPINDNGSGFNTNVESCKVYEGDSVNSISRINISKVGNQFLSENVILTGSFNSNIEYSTFLKSYEKKTDIFKRKFMSDYRSVENVFSKEYINENKNVSLQDGLNTTIEYLSVCYVPTYDIFYLNSANPFDYLAPASSSTRLNSYYQLNTDSYENDNVTTYTLVQPITNDYKLYPKIAISDWKNEYNDPTIVDTTFDNGSVGWDTIDNVFTRFDDIIDNSNLRWLKPLFKLTYAYIKYGNVNYTLTTEENTQLDNDYNAFNATNIRYIEDEIFISVDQTSVSKTKIVFTEETMASYV